MIGPHLSLRVPLDSKWFTVYQYCIPLAWVSLLPVQGRSCCLTAWPLGCYRFSSMSTPSIALDREDLWLTNDVWCKWIRGNDWPLDSWKFGPCLYLSHWVNGGDRAFRFQPCVMRMALVGTPSYSVERADHGVNRIPLCSNVDLISGERNYSRRMVQKKNRDPTEFCGFVICDCGGQALAVSIAIGFAVYPS